MATPNPPPLPAVAILSPRSVTLAKSVLVHEENSAVPFAPASPDVVAAITIKQLLSVVVSPVTEIEVSEVDSVPPLVTFQGLPLVSHPRKAKIRPT